MSVTPSLRHVADRVRGSFGDRRAARRLESGRPSPQRLVLMGGAVLSVAVALVVVQAATDLVMGALSVGVLVLAVVGVRQPDTLIPAAVIGFVAAGWLASEASPTSPAVPAVAAALALFHTVAALLASVPPQATVPRDVLRRWTIRWLVVVASTATWWGVLVVLDRRDAGSSSITTVGALAAIVFGVLMVRHRVLATAAGAPRRDRGRIAG